MLDLGLSAGFEYLGIGHRTIAYCEREAYAASQLLALMESECLDAAPIWPDLTTFPASEFRGVVDCITAGFPCQPHSVAGKREGTDDARWIWPAIVGIIRDSGAWLVVLENVRGLLSSGGMAPVLADLADLGFTAEWTVLSAGEVGASHRRERVFIVGVADSHRGRLQQFRRGGLLDGIRTAQRDDADGCDIAGVDDADGAERRALRERGTDSEQRNDGERREADCWPGIAVATLADPGCRSAGPQQHIARTCGCATDDCACDAVVEYAASARPAGRRSGASGAVRDEARRGESCGRRDGMADTSSAGSQISRGGGSDDGSLQPTSGTDTDGIHPLFAPGPSDPRWPGIIRERPDLAPAVESSVRSLAHGLAGMVDESRRDQLRATGNGVCPLQAAAAIVALVNRLKE